MSRKRHLAEKAAGGGYRDQIRAILKPMCAFGTSKHEDARAAKEAGLKPNDVTFGKIYSHKTYENYFKESCLFMKWAKANHGCVVVAEAKKYAQEYIKQEIDRGMSPSTIKKRAAALGKLYQDSVLTQMQTPPRVRADITRSRSTVTRDSGFNEEKHAKFVEVCRSTGLRRHEFRRLSDAELVTEDGKLWIKGVKGKGGKVRDIPVMGNESLVQEYIEGAIKKPPTLPSHADIHSYRADYAARLYKSVARPIAEVPRNERYDCRGDLSGTHLDRNAMQVVSNALGHNRIDVVAGHYAYKFS